MVKKFNVDIVRVVLTSQGFSHDQIDHAIEEMKRLASEEQQQAEGERGVRVKQKHVLVITGLPEGYNPAIASAWIMKMPEEQGSEEVLDNIAAAANSYNQSLRDNARNLKVRNLAETMEFVPAKFFKETHSTRVTKEPVDIINGEIMTPDVFIPLGENTDETTQTETTEE